MATLAVVAAEIPARERWRWRGAGWWCDRCGAPLGAARAWWRRAEREIDAPALFAARCAGDAARDVTLAVTVFVRPLDPFTGLATQPAAWCDPCARAAVAREGVLCARAARDAAMRARWARAPLASPWEALAPTLGAIVGETVIRAEVEADARARRWRAALARRWGVVVTRATRPRCAAILREVRG